MWDGNIKATNKLFHTNGFIVVSNPQLIDKITYEGVYGIIWPLEDLDEIKNKLLYQDLKITLELDTVHVATNWDAAYQYWRKCLLLDINVRLLLLETALNWPLITKYNDLLWEEIGYDVAYAEGDFYSAIQQELLIGKVKLLESWIEKLNDCGLFPDFASAEAFKNARCAVEAGIETVGDFYVIHLYKYIGE